MKEHLVSETGQVFTKYTKRYANQFCRCWRFDVSWLYGEIFETNDYRMSLKQGAASGSATAFSVGELLQES